MWRAVVSQPFDRTQSLEAQGDIDSDAGEFWVENPFMMPEQGHNLSAFESNRLFLNYQGREFLDVSFASNADIDSDSRAVVAADFDGDNDIDLLVGNVGGGPLRLFSNEFPDSGHRVRLVLKTTRSNRAAIGTRVTARLPDGRQVVRDMFLPSGFRGQAPINQIIGVGDVEQISSLMVRWPNGESQEFTELPVDHRLVVTEGQGGIAATPLQNMGR